MECNLCKKPTKKQCSRCRAKYYCSSSCQKEDYAKHVLDCPPRSADTLVRNVFDNKMPTKLAVLHEYGFNNCIKPNDKIMLLGLYIGLIDIIGCSASEIHSWWENGELALNIKRKYDGKGYTSGYYEWFSKNEHVLRGLHKYEGEKSDKSLTDSYLQMIKPYFSEHDQAIPMQLLPESKRHVAALYTIVLIGSIPRIEHPSWIDFGFCTCKVGEGYLEEVEEKRLSELYEELIIQKGCKIDEFNDAYISGTVIDLLKRKCDNCSWLTESRIEVPQYKQPIKSVYYLKQYALCESVKLSNAVNVDYGFFNCQSKDEIRELRGIYNKLIKTPQFDPRDLHKACLAGKIFNYVSSILPNEVLKVNLFRNMYPLKDY